MAKVMKSFRLSESAIAALENRDTQKLSFGSGIHRGTSF